MSLPFSDNDSFDRTMRASSLQAVILASLAETPRTEFDVRRFVQAQPGYEWASFRLVHHAIDGLLKRERVVRHWQEGFTFAFLSLPDDPMHPFVAMKRKEVARDMQILGSMEWPRFFDVPYAMTLDGSKSKGIDPELTLNRRPAFF